MSTTVKQCHVNYDVMQGRTPQEMVPLSVWIVSHPKSASKSHPNIMMSFTHVILLERWVVQSVNHVPLDKRLTFLLLVVSTVVKVSIPAANE